LSSTVLVGALIGAAGLFLIFHSLGRAQAPEKSGLETRLKSYAGPSGSALDELELQKPFSERVLVPLVWWFREMLSRATPDKARESLQIKLNLAGNPNGLQPSDFLLIRYIAAIIVFVGGLALGILAHSPMWIALCGCGGGLLGYYFPQLWLNQQVKGRQQALTKALPDTLDLLTVAVEAGLGFDAAVSRVVEKFRNELSDELASVLQEARLGRPRLEALDAMGRRTGVEEIHNFTQAVIQSESMGVGIAKILRLQSDELRRRRRQKAQEKAAQASLKMMLPMVGCIFPTLWIILLGPSILILMKARG
jgi:tight adherence protein C